MNIWYISPIILNKKNAWYTHTIELFKNLKMNNNIVLFSFTTKKKSDFENNKILIKTIDKPLLWALIGEIRLFFSLFKSYKRNNRVDIIYIRNSSFLFFHWIITKIFQVPFVIEINGIFSEEWKLSNKPKLFIWFMDKLFKIAHQNATKIIAVSESIKSILIQSHHVSQKNIVVIPNGANTDIFKPLHKEKIRNRLQLDSSFFYIGFSGAFKAWHGLEELVESAPCIIEKIPNTKFVFVGDGELKNKIMEMVKKLGITHNCIFINRVPYKTIPKYINAFDIGIILKKREIPGSPLKLWEYMACGIPVIGTDSEDFEILKKENAGILVDPNDIKSISYEIVKLLKNKQLIQELGLNGMQYVLNNRSWKAVSEQIERELSKTVI